MPSPPRRSRCGQATSDYVALLCLVAVFLAGAGAAVAGAPVAASVAHALRLALCAVGGDVCLGSQARAAGLEPCVVADERYRSRWSASGLIFKSSQEHSYAIERRSDGGITVTAGHDRDAGAGIRVGARLGPAAASVEAGAAGGWRSGMVWELAGARALRSFLRRAPRPHRIEHDADWRRAGLPAPSTRFLAGGASAELQASVEAGVVIPLVTAGGRAALGRRVGPRGTAWYFDVPAASARALGGSLPEVELARVGPWSVELDAPTGSRVERVVLRSAARGANPGEEIQLTRVVDLDEGRAAAAVRDLLSPARTVAAARALGRMGSLQRDVYRVRELDSGLDAELAAAVVGLGHADARSSRRLISSTVVDPEGRVARRADCLPDLLG